VRHILQVRQRMPRPGSDIGVPYLLESGGSRLIPPRRPISRLRTGEIIIAGSTNPCFPEFASWTTQAPLRIKLRHRAPRVGNQPPTQAGPFLLARQGPRLLWLHRSPPPLSPVLSNLAHGKEKRDYKCSQRFPTNERSPLGVDVRLTCRCGQALVPRSAYIMNDPEKVSSRAG
jgi:hypothetical protein